MKSENFKNFHKRKTCYGEKNIGNSEMLSKIIIKKLEFEIFKTF